MFGWWPQAWAIHLGTDGHYRDRALLITAALLLLLGTVVAAPVVEELYFAASCCRGCRTILIGGELRSASVCLRRTPGHPG